MKFRAAKIQPNALHGGGSMGATTKPGRKTSWVRFSQMYLAVLLLLPVFGAQAEVLFTRLHSFQVFTNGSHPATSLVQGRDGNFYGTTSDGGVNQGGTVFRIGTNSMLTTLYSFTGGDDGADPEGALVQGIDGNLYGTTANGGTNGSGTVFKISTNGAFASLYSFTGGDDGASPSAALVQGADGNFYGVTTGGGVYGAGTVFGIGTNGVLTSLYYFTGGMDGGGPVGLAQGSDGDFYGATYQGGADNYGTVFKIGMVGPLIRLYSFTGGDDGANPGARLIQGGDGNFYGTTEAGGTNNAGAVFKISATGTFTGLYSFTGGNDGAEPFAGLARGSDGNFYGTTYLGGGTNDAGTVFKISANGTLTTLYSFTDGNDGANPGAELVQGNNGSFYGTTYYGGPSDAGVVFRIGTSGPPTSLYAFVSSNDGAFPTAGLMQGSDGSFYGTTQDGGTNGAGVVFKISAGGSFSNLYTFTGGNDGANPWGALVQGSDGILYGMTHLGGTNNMGAVFKITTNAAFTRLYSFTGGNDGARPFGRLLQGKDGNFYGTTESGGTNGGWGTVFKITTNGVLNAFYSFSNGIDGATPAAGLLQASNGVFYGTAYGGGSNGYGTVFKISTNGAFASLYSFTAGNDGSRPESDLTQGGDGNLYSTTSFGAQGYGTVFKIGTNGTLRTLYTFTGGSDGGNPYGVLVQVTNGNFYGTTSVRGLNGHGTVFEITTNGTLTTLYSFTGRNDGASPQAGLTPAGSGVFYGTAESGGSGGAGAVFRLTLAPQFQMLQLTNHNVNLTWSTEMGWKYQLQYNSDLNSGAWTNLGSGIPASGATLSATDSVAGGPRRFYRVEILP